MVQLANCPHCDREVALPASYGEEQHGECPACRQQFALAEAATRPVEELKLVSPEENKGDDTAPEHSAMDPPSHTVRRVVGGMPLSSFLRNGTDLGNDTDLDNRTEEKEPHQDPPHSHAEQPLQQEAVAPSLNELQQRYAAEESPADAATNPSIPNPFDRLSTAAGLPQQRTEEMANHQQQPGVTPPPAITPLEIFDQPTTDSTATPPPAELPQFDFHVGESEKELESSEPPVVLQEAPPLMLALEENLKNDSQPLAAEPLFATEPSGTEPVAGNAAAGWGFIAERPSLGRRRSRHSVLRIGAGIVVGGILGIAAGAWALLWILHVSGHTDDPLQLARWFPDTMLPVTYQSTPHGVPVESEPSTLKQPSPLLDAPPDKTSPAPSGPLGVAVADARDEKASPNNAYPVTPASFEHSASATAVFRPQNTPRFSLEELIQVVEETLDAPAGLIVGRLEDAEVRPTKGRSYAQLAQLAHVLTFAKAPQQPGQLSVAQRAAQQLFVPLFRQHELRQEIALIADYWRQSPRRQHGGFFVGGTLQKPVQRGSVWECPLQLPSGSQLTLLAPAAVFPALQDAASQEQFYGIVGHLLEQPADHLEGYTGNATEGVWTSWIFPVD